MFDALTKINVIWLILTVTVRWLLFQSKWLHYNATTFCSVCISKQRIFRERIGVWFSVRKWLVFETCICVNVFWPHFWLPEREMCKTTYIFLILWQLLAHLLGLGAGTSRASYLLVSEQHCSTAIKTHPAGLGLFNDKGLFKANKVRFKMLKFIY